MKLSKKAWGWGGVFYNVQWPQDRPIPGLVHVKIHFSIYKTVELKSGPQNLALRLRACISSIQSDRCDQGFSSPLSVEFFSSPHQNSSTKTVKI
jgi:hypothetical protein